MAATIAAAPNEGVGPADTAEHPFGARDWLPSLLVIALAVIPKLWYLDAAVFGQDESILLVYPEQISLGRIPNRDFFTVYGPGNYITLAGVYAVFGQTLISERLVGILYQTMIVTGVMTLTRRFGHGVSVSCGVTSALLLSGPNSIALSWMGGLALCLSSLSLLQREGTRRALIAGVIAGLMPFWRLEMAALMLAALPLLWRDSRSRYYVTGVAIGLIPIACHLLVAGGETLQNVFLDRMGANAQVDWELLPHVDFVACGLLLVGAAWLLIIGRHDRFSMSSGILALLMLPQALQRIDFIHIVVMTGSVVYALALAPLFAKVRLALKRHLVVVFMCAALIALTFQSATSTSGEKVTHRGRSLYVTDAQEATRLVAAVRTHFPVGSRVFVGTSDMSVATGNWTALYHLLPEYRSDFYFLELHVGVAERPGSALASDVRSADALVLTANSPDLGFLYPHFPAGSEAANRAVIDGFCAVERLSNVTLYVKKTGSCPKSSSPAG